MGSNKNCLKIKLRTFSKNRIQIGISDVQKGQEFLRSKGARRMISLVWKQVIEKVNKLHGLKNDDN